MPPSKPWTLISPASRGIGRAFARHILQTTRAPVVATARGDLDNAKESILDGLSAKDAQNRLKMVKMDFLDESSISAAASQCTSHFPSQDNWHLHLALILPGILFTEKSPAQVNAKDALLTYQTNTLGPLLAMKHFAGLLPTRKSSLSSSETGDGEMYTGLPPTHATFACMSARVGSTSANKLGGWYTYRSSKAALNQLVKTFDLHLLNAHSGERNAMAVGMHPGTVKTGLSGEMWESEQKKQEGGKREGVFEPEEAAERLMGVLKELDVGKGRGRIWDWKGEEVPP